jgi:hypothetical protein
MESSSSESIFLTDGDTSINDTSHMPKDISDARPANDVVPVYDHVLEMNEGFLRKDDGTDKSLIDNPFQSTSPWPKRALKSPAITSTWSFLEFQDKQLEPAVGILSP